MTEDVNQYLFSCLTQNTHIYNANKRWKAYLQVIPHYSTYYYITAVDLANEEKKISITMYLFAREQDGVTSDYQTQGTVAQK